jgi:hypothetical protein
MIVSQTVLFCFFVHLADVAKHIRLARFFSASKFRCPCGGGGGMSYCGGDVLPSPVSISKVLTLLTGAREQECIATCLNSAADHTIPIWQFDGGTTTVPWIFTVNADNQAPS